MISYAPDPRGWVFASKEVRPEGLRALNQWPSRDQLAEMLPELLATLAAEADEDESGVLKRAADVVQGVAIATIADAIQEVTGLR